MVAGVDTSRSRLSDQLEPMLSHFEQQENVLHHLLFISVLPYWLNECVAFSYFLVAEMSLCCWIMACAALSAFQWKREKSANVNMIKNLH
jgi:hypothetical protein